MYIRQVNPVYFITGTGTGAGKTVLAALCVRYLRRQGIAVAGLKPICSGGRDDARALAAAGDHALPLDAVNPWHFRAPIAPALAARKEKRSVSLSHVVAHVRAMRQQVDALVVEGAGGLLSPLGKDFDSRDLLLSLRARPIIVAPNILGTINPLRLTLEALPPRYRRAAKVVLMAPKRPDAATPSNAKLLGEFFDPGKIFQLPRLDPPLRANAIETRQVRATLSRLLA